jgi:hypothetical protein
LITNLPKQEATQVNDDSDQAAVRAAETAALVRATDRIRAHERAGDITRAEAGQMIGDAHTRYDMHLLTRTAS